VTDRRQTMASPLIDAIAGVDSPVATQNDLGVSPERTAVAVARTDRVGSPR
jgi:hypothetical protein